MFFLHRIWIISVALVPALVHAQSALDVPSNGAKLSGIGVIHGWKCEARGNITIRFNDRDPIPTTYGFPRGDTATACGNDGNNGFVSYFNWAILGDGKHTARAYDDGVLFAESTFEVTTTGEEFLIGARGECRISDFPGPKETTTFEWNQATQHLEMTSVEDSSDAASTPKGE